MIKGDTIYRFITDHLGSIRLVVNTTSGAVTQRLDYDEYGNITYNSNPDFTPFTYAGGLYDAQTKLVRFGFRDYDASVGRWTVKDPILFAGGETSLYSYVGSNPINLIDRTGLWKPKGHKMLTYLAMYGRFDKETIRKVTEANIHVDRLTNQLNDPAHYMPGNQAEAERLIENMLQLAIVNQNEGFYDNAAKLLGSGLHILQDRYSHYEQDGDWWDHIFQLIGLGKRPDKISKHPCEFKKAYEASQKYIERFIAGTRGGG